MDVPCCFVNLCYIKADHWYGISLITSDASRISRSCIMKVYIWSVEPLTIAL